MIVWKVYLISIDIFLFVVTFIILIGILLVLLNMRVAENGTEVSIYQNQVSLQTPYNDNQGYHPKVISFKEKWHGYKYWMAYTPYPLADSSKENPVINVSNDRKKWVNPDGIKNPLDIPYKINKKIYNSDTHLLYNEDNDTLELFWRFVDDEQNKIIIYRMISKDGVNWNKKEVFLESDNRIKSDFVSPAIYYNDHKYHIWYVAKNSIYYFEKIGDHITAPEKINVTFSKKMYPWHIDVIYNDTKEMYEMVLCAYDNIYDRSDMSLYYTSSKNNKEWTEAILILEPSKIDGNWDSKELYRSSLIYEDGVYYLFYSGHDDKYNVGIGLASAKDINYLRRIKTDK